MKKIFLRRTWHKVVAPVAIDCDDFFQRVCRALDGAGMHRVSSGEVSMDVRNRVLMVSYGVRINVRHRRVKYQFGSENVVMAIVFMIFGGMLLFKGRFDTYLFWSGLVAGVLYWMDNLLTCSRIDGAIRSCLPKKDEALPVEPDPSCSITQQYTCPACGCFLSGFGSSCPCCGISLGYKQESVTNFKNYRMKYFL